MILSLVDCEKSALPWFGVQTKPNAEKAAARQLEVRGYDVFLPTQRRESRWSDRAKQVDYPLFPGYLFCRLDSAVSFRIVCAPGVVRIIGHGTVPEPIPESEIASIQAILRSGFLVEPHHYLREGQTITITKGPLKGIDGLLVSNKNKFKVVVSVSLLQRSVAVELDQDSVRGAFNCSGRWDDYVARRAAILEHSRP